MSTVAWKSTGKKVGEGLMLPVVNDMGVVGVKVEYRSTNKVLVEREDVFIPLQAFLAMCRDNYTGRLDPETFVADTSNYFLKPIDPPEYRDGFKAGLAKALELFNQQQIVY